LNEVQLLRRQIATERQHLREAAVRLSDLVNSKAYDRYIMYSIGMQRARARSHIARFGAHASMTGDERSALAGLQQALADTADSPAALNRILHLIDATETIEKLAEGRYGVEDWRSVAQVDADSILEERRLWAEVIRHGTVTAGS